MKNIFRRKIIFRVGKIIQREYKIFGVGKDRQLVKNFGRQEAKNFGSGYEGAAF